MPRQHPPLGRIPLAMSSTALRLPSSRRQTIDSIALHRSEGVGREMAEALQLGVDAIATSYGGNIDFCIGPSPTPFAMDTCGRSQI